VPTFEYIRRPRGSSRNRRLGDSSEISDGHLDSDSEENTDDHVDSPDMQSALGSEDDPRGEPTTRSRCTDTREGYPHPPLLQLVLTTMPGENKTTRTKKGWEKKLNTGQSLLIY
jgi:hypothetical protein